MTVTLKGHYADVATLSSGGHVTISPVSVDPETDEVTSVRRIVDSVGNVVYDGTPVKIDLVFGSFSTPLLATDDPNLNPTGFGYQLIKRTPGDLPPSPVIFSLPAAVPIVDVADVTPALPEAVWMPESAGPHTHEIDSVTGLDAELDALQAALDEKADLVSGKVPTSQIPSVSIGETFSVASQAAMLALSAQMGDVAIRTDLSSHRFLLTGTNPATLADWVNISEPGGAVDSVNGQTGVVVLSAADVGAAATRTTVSQAEAEAGTATTVRDWTAERVRQATIAGVAAGYTPPSQAVAEAGVASGATLWSAQRVSQAARAIAQIHLGGEIKCIWNGSTGWVNPYTGAILGATRPTVPSFVYFTLIGGPAATASPFTLADGDMRLDTL
jgi:hypothetical protein